MIGDERKSRSLSDEEHERELDTTRIRRDRLLSAMHRLEDRLSSAAPGRERDWASKVMESIRDLDDGMRQRIDAGYGILSDIETSAPHLWPRAERLRKEYANLKRRARELLTELEDAGGEVADYRDIRQRAGWLLSALKHQQAQETDLIFEAYNRDIGVGD